VDLRTNSDISLYSINWLVLYEKFKPLKSSGHYMYRQFNIQQFYVLPTQCINVSLWIWEQTVIFPYTALTHWYYKRDLTLYSPVVTICTASLTFNISTFCLHCVFMCFVWISEQTAIISLHNINWLVFKTETQCVYCAVRTVWWYWFLQIFLLWVSCSPFHTP